MAVEECVTPDRNFPAYPNLASADFAARRMTRRSLGGCAPNHFGARWRSRVWLLGTTGLPVGLHDPRCLVPLLQSEGSSCHLLSIFQNDLIYNFSAADAPPPVKLFRGAIVFFVNHEASTSMTPHSILQTHFIGLHGQSFSQSHRLTSLGYPPSCSSLLFPSRKGPPDGIQKGVIINGFSKENYGSEFPGVLTGLHIIAR